LNSPLNRLRERTVRDPLRPSIRARSVRVGAIESPRSTFAGFPSDSGSTKATAADSGSIFPPPFTRVAIDQGRWELGLPSSGIVTRRTARNPRGTAGMGPLRVASVPGLEETAEGERAENFRLDESSYDRSGPRRQLSGAQS